MAKKPSPKKIVATLMHDTDKRKNIPTAEFQAVVKKDQQSAIRVAFERRNRDLDPQLVWRGKDEKDWSDLVVHAPPLYIQEKLHPKVLIDDLLKQTAEQEKQGKLVQADLFADFNGIPKDVDKTDFYQHDQNWSNRMILGDSLHVMASLAEREGLRGKVQCIYLDPPYGIKYNSNFQWSTTSRDVKDGNLGHITREPEQVKAFRDTWRDGIHSYLTNLRDRFTVARDLLTDSGSIFVQIGDENVHRVRAVMDEVFGDNSAVAEIIVEKTAGASMEYIDSVADFILWYAKDKTRTKYRQLFYDKKQGRTGLTLYKFIQDSDTYRRSLTSEEKDKVEHLTDKGVFTVDALTSQTQASTTRYKAQFRGREFESGVRQWATPPAGFMRLTKGNVLSIELAASDMFVFTTTTQ